HAAIHSFPTRRSSDLLLNMSFVLTASSKFNETLDSIVKGLQESGFSKDDYYAEEAPEEELTPNEVLTQDLFAEEPKPDDYVQSRSEEHTSELQSRENL